MPDEQSIETGVARFDGLLVMNYPPDPTLDSELDGALRVLTNASPVRFSIQREPGSLTILPDTAPVPFPGASRPSGSLLPAVRELVDAVRRRSEVRVETSLRVQEYLGDSVLEGVFVFRKAEGIDLVVRERSAAPGERPRPPEIPLGVRAESVIRKYQWPLLGLVIVLVTVGLFGWQAGWWGIDAGSVGGPKIDAGVLDGVVSFERVRWRKDRVSFDLRPGPEFDRFDAAAAKCSLRTGVFRVVFRKDGRPVGAILPLDLRDFPERGKSLGGEEIIRIDLPWDGSGFDEVWVCR